ncbi:putative transcription factor interactor and regulator CCHC(Zn) family [Helianthus debilis subsp. tardiflorus]
MAGESGGVKPLNQQSPGIDDHTPPVRGIGLRVTNIEGNPMMPRRGMFSTSNVSVIDGLFEISKPVDLPSTWDYGGGSSTANMDSQLNPSSNNVINDAPVLSYTDKVKTQNPLKREVNFRKLDATETVQDADVLIPREVIKKVQDKFENVLYGYFLGNRLPFPVVEYYAKNVWSKYGFAKIMMNSDGFFFFKFDSKEGMMKVLEGGPWLIRKVPLFLNVWSPSVNLIKECIKSVPVWVKLHNVPIAIYTDDGLSLLASKLGTPKRLDGYTADMCVDNWGRSSFARALIEISADNDLKDYITVAIPKLEEDGYITHKVKVEYEWKPQRCSSCCVFGHSDQSCPKNVAPKAKQVVIDEEGFVTDTRKVARHGFPQKKQKAKVVYRPKGSHAGSGPSGTKSADGATSSGTKHDKPNNAVRGSVEIRNSFEALNSTEGDTRGVDIEKQHDSGPQAYDGNKNGSLQEEEVVDRVQTEMASFMSSKPVGKNTKGASPPDLTVLNG